MLRSCRHGPASALGPWPQAVSAAPLTEAQTRLITSWEEPRWRSDSFHLGTLVLGISDEGQERALAAPMCGPSSCVGSAAGLSQLRVNQHLPPWGAKAHGDRVAVASVYDSLNMSSVLLNSVNGKNIEF